MTPEEKMENVLAQVRAADDGRTNTLTCPYCHKVNHENVPFCCDLFSEACIAALERIRWEQAKGEMHRIAERHANN